MLSFVCARFSTSKAACSKMVTKPWLDVLLSVVAIPSRLDTDLLVLSMRTRMLTMNLLEIILPACSAEKDGELMSTVSVFKISLILWDYCVQKRCVYRSIKNP